MFASYNKNNTKGALVGNWVEEDALRSVTGYSRRKIPAPMFSSDMKESRVEYTQSRVLGPGTTSGKSSDAVYETTTQASTKYGSFAVSKPGSGPRSSLREIKLLEQAKQIQNQQKLQREMEQQAQIASESVTKASYQPLDPSVLVGASHVPRGRNGSRVVDSAIQHLTKSQVDSIDQMKLELLQGATVTRYSHAIATGVGLNFTSTVSDSSNPFGRSSTFTNEITDPTKRHGEAMEPGSAHDERVGTNLHQRSALKRLRLILQQDQAIENQLKELLCSKAEGNHYVQLHSFREAFAGVDIPLSEKEVIHIFMYFDVDNIGAISLFHFLDNCHGRTNTPLPS